MSRDLDGRGCAWCDLPATRWTMAQDWPACDRHGIEMDRLHESVQKSKAAMVQAEAEADACSTDLVTILQVQRVWSLETFGPGDRYRAILDHLHKELIEVRSEPRDVEEWIDVAILALDGARRTGATPEQVAAALVAKEAKNRARTWPDWRTADPNRAIEHVEPGDEVSA